MFKNYDTVICPNNVKKDILKKLTKEKKIINIKFYTLEEFKNKYFGTYNEKAIYYLMEKYGYKYDVALTYLKNFNSNEILKKELFDNDLIVKEKINITRIIVIGYNKIDKYILDEISKYDLQIITNKQNDYQNKVYEFDTIESEINFTINKIIDLLKTTDINNICLVNVGSDYELILKRLFKFYNIPINLNTKKSIYGTKIVQDFLKNLKEKREYILIDNEVSEQIVNVINKYAFAEIDDTLIEIIESVLKNTYILDKKYENAINIVDIEDIEDTKHYFVMGFNEGVLPKIYKDEDFLSDQEKSKLGILTSIEKNILDKELVKNKISQSNVTLTYSVQDKYPSSLIEEMNMEVIKDETEYHNSDTYNKLLLSRKLDNLIKYNEIDNNLDLLYSNYKDIDYLKYDNKFTGIDKDKFYKYIDNKLLLSYSSIDNYNRCGFKYYINNVLKLNQFNETFMTYIGNLFHYILSIYNNKDFDFEKEFSKFINNKEFNKKEEFFINKLKKDLLFTIDTIKKYDSYSTLDESLYEEKIYINKDKNIKVTFMGIVDKIKYKKESDKTIVAIIDYKTGNPSININNSIYGIDMQLPIYLYLVKNSKLDNIEYAGFYLQKIVHNKLSYNKDKDYNDELEKLYRLEGYSTDDESLLNIFDKTYMHSKMIKGMKVSSNGFYAYTKTLNKENINELINLVDKKIEESRDNILEAKFDINPKKIGFDLVGCEYCTFKDLCFKKEQDIVKLEEKNIFENT